MNNFIISYFNERLSYKLTLNRINLVLVNPTYTTKECCNCHSLNTVLRDGYFKCNSCMVGTSKVANILSNLLNRYGDKRFALSVSASDIRRFLEQQAIAATGKT